MRVWVACLLLVATPAFAVDHTINFACCSYTPANPTISAGDRVIWNGAFGSHPLLQVTGANSDTPVPGGFANNVGSTFSVTFPDPGVYFYLCTAHGQFGGQMRGAITVLQGDAVFDDGFE